MTHLFVLAYTAYNGYWMESVFENIVQLFYYFNTRQREPSKLFLSLQCCSVAMLCRMYWTRSSLTVVMILIDAQLKNIRCSIVPPFVMLLKRLVPVTQTQGIEQQLLTPLTLEFFKVSFTTSFLYWVVIPDSSSWMTLFIFRF